MLDEKTKQSSTFEKLYKRKLSEDETAEIRHNFFGLMDLLIEIDKEQKAEKESKND